MNKRQIPKPSLSGQGEGEIVEILIEYIILARRRGAWSVESVSQQVVRSVPSRNIWTALAQYLIQVALAFRWLVRFLPASRLAFIPPFSFRNLFPLSFTGQWLEKNLKKGPARLRREYSWLRRECRAGRRREKKANGVPPVVPSLSETKPRIYERHPNVRWKETRSARLLYIRGLIFQQNARYSRSTPAFIVPSIAKCVVRTARIECRWTSSDFGTKADAFRACDSWFHLG